MTEFSYNSAETAYLATLCRGIALRCASAYLVADSDSEDFSQEFTMRVLNSADLSTLLKLPSCDRCALLSRIARCDCIDFIRSIGRRRTHEALSLQRSADAHGRLDLVDPRNDPAAIVERGALRQALHAAIGSLMPSASLVLMLYHLEHLTIAEIASQTGRSVVAVRQCLYASRRTLRIRLSACGWTEADVREAMQTPAAPCVAGRRAPDGD